jgi:hypothetical protein
LLGINERQNNMAWNPEPRVADCREIARKWGGKKQVIIIALDEKGCMDMATYGETKQLCTVAKKLGEVGLDAINNFIALVDAAIDA